MKPYPKIFTMTTIWILALVSNVLILEKRNSSTVVNKSLNVGRNTEIGGKKKQIIGAEEKQRKEEEKGEQGFSLYIYVK